MEPGDVLGLFRESGALLDGHFRLSSGLHSAGYLQCALVLQDPARAEALGRAIAERTRAYGAEMVISPALGGVIIGHEVGRALGVRAIFAERQDGTLTLRRGFTVAPGQRILVVEDVVTTAGSTRETIEVARASGGAVVAAAAIIDRGAEPSRLDVPFEPLVRHVLATYEPAACPLCRAGAPIVKPGSRM